MSTGPDPVEMSREEHTISGGRRLLNYSFVVADETPADPPSTGNLDAEEPEKAE